MKSIYQILTQIKNDAQTDIPDMVYADGLPAFDVFEIGQSRDDSQTAFFIYQDKVSHDQGQNIINLVYQLQLPGVSVADAAKYADVMLDYLTAYDFAKIGMIRYTSISIETWPNTLDRTTIIFCDVSVIEELDSCDE